MTGRPRSPPTPLWISDAVLAAAFVRFCHSRRFASNVPGPLESRRRLGKRQMADLHRNMLPAALPAAWTSAAVSAAADLRRQWQWTPPRDDAAREAREADVRGLQEARHAWAAVVEALPSWMSGRRGDSEDAQDSRDSQDAQDAQDSRDSRSLFADLDAWTRSHSDSATDSATDPATDLDARFAAVCAAFHAQLRLAALRPDDALVVFDRLYRRHRHLSDVATLFAAVLDGVRSCRLLQPRGLGPVFWQRLLACAVDVVTTDTANTSLGRLAAEILLTAPPELVRQLPAGALSVLLAAALTSGSTAAIQRANFSSISSISSTSSISTSSISSTSSTSTSSTSTSPLDNAAWTSDRLHHQLAVADAACAAGDLARASTALRTARGLHQSCSRALWQADQLLASDTAFVVAMAAVVGDVDPAALVTATSRRLLSMPASVAARQRWLLVLAHLPRVRQDGLFAALHSFGAGLALPRLCRLLLAHWLSRGYVTPPALLSFDRLVTTSTPDDIALAALGLAVFRSKHSRSRCVALLLSLGRALQLLGRDAPTELVRSVEALAAVTATSTPPSLSTSALPGPFLEAVAWAADDVTAVFRLYAVYAAQPTRATSPAWSIAFWDKFADRMAAGLDDGSLALAHVAYLLHLPATGQAKPRKQTDIQSPTVRLVERLAAHYALTPGLPSRQAIRGVELCRAFLRRHRHGSAPVPSPATLRALFHLVTRDLDQAQPGRTSRLRWYLAAVEKEYSPDVARASARALARWRVLAVQTAGQRQRALEVAAHQHPDPGP